MDGIDPLPLTVDECIQMLLALTVDCPATIIIDGLDELVRNQLDILTNLRTLASESSSLVKIMISSREDTHIAQELHDALSLPVTVCENSEDIKVFVQHSVSSAITNRKLLGGSFSSALDAALAGSSGPVIKFLLEASRITDRPKLEKILARASYDGHDEVVTYLLGEISQNEENDGNAGELLTMKLKSVAEE